MNREIPYGGGLNYCYYNLDIRNIKQVNIVIFCSEAIHMGSLFKLLICLDIFTMIAIRNLLIFFASVMKRRAGTARESCIEIYLEH